MSPMIQEFAESRIVRWCSIECRGKSLECPRIELEEVAIQENRRGFARCGVEHELRSILPDRLCGAIDQRHIVWTLVSKVCYLAHQGNLTHGVRREFLTGTVGVLILSLLSEREMYGYELLREAERRSASAFQLKEGRCTRRSIIWSDPGCSRGGGVTARRTIAQVLPSDREGPAPGPVKTSAVAADFGRNAVDLG